jgi:beta-lactam-binding protein with PASTA domain
MRVCRLDKWLPFSFAVEYRIRLTNLPNYCTKNLMLKDYLWILPFFCFLLGYQLLNVTTTNHELEAPALIGLPLTEAIKILSNNNLNTRIVAQTEEQNLPNGTVLSQTPAAHQRVKQNQPIFLVVSKKPEPIRTPNLLGRDRSEIVSIGQKQRIRIKYYELMNTKHPKDYCIGQYPTPDTPIKDGTMIAYVSAGNQTTILFPDFRQTDLHHAQEMLADIPCQITVNHSTPVDSEHQCISCVITDQKPLPGSLITTTKPLNVQLQVKG